MVKIIMLGTGNGGTVDLYNTCFIIQNENGNFLVDTGGSIEIIKRLKKVDIDIKDIQNIFISHSHTDHILGLIWMFKKLWVKRNEIREKLNIYCNDKVYEAIKGVAAYVLPEKLRNDIYQFIDFVILNDDETVNINGIDYTFFDINAKGDKQYGFEANINEKRLIFLGDESMNPILKDRVRNADYVMHEAFCLDAEEIIFKAYEKNHSTAKSACEFMNDLNIKNLILYHTEESHGTERKSLYEKEGKQVFRENLIVPNDLEEINI